MAQINKPNLHFNTLLYTGNNTSPRSITGVGFQPDFVWIKDRSDSSISPIADVVRGANKSIKFSSNAADETNSAYGYLTSFDSDGFSMAIGSSNFTRINENSNSYVSWNFKAGNSQGSSNTDGDINTTYTSVNTTSGFSISQYTGNGNAGATVGHGLGAVPRLIIVKALNTTDNWEVYHGSLGAEKYLELQSNAAQADSTQIWNDTEPTNQVFSIGINSGVNTNGNPYIAYCFAEKKGFSKFGSYTGNGNSSGNGPFIYTGFKPAFVVYKNASAVYHWGVFDNKRSPFNVKDDLLFPNLSNAESAGDGRKIDMLSNGFKVRVTSDTNDINGSGNTIVYWAFAENPLVGTNKVPATAE